jgi:hypothetical protein
LAILWGGGDIEKTLGIAVSAGYDCDNQAATVGGLMGVLHGASKLPAKYTKELPEGTAWETPYNNLYINHTRDGLPNSFALDDIVERTVALALQARKSKKQRRLGKQA